jgi:integrase
MAISTEIYAKRKPGTRWNPDKHTWIGYRIDVRVRGRRYRNGPFPTKRDAETFIEQLKLQGNYRRAGIKAPNVSKQITIRQLADKRIESLIERKQRELEKRVLNYFVNVAGETTRVEEITVSHFRSFTDKRSKELTVRNVPVKPQTVDREIAIVAATLHSAGKYFEELENYRPPRIPRPKFKKSRRERIITESERTGLLEALHPIDRSSSRIFEFATLTGLRHSEIMQLRKTDLDRSARSLKVYRSKTDTTSYISPLTGRMLELLESEFDGPYIFTRDGKTPPLFYQHMKAACEQCGITYGRFAADGVILHDARHSFITRLQQAGIDLATIQSFSGHSSRELVMRYSHARPESRRRAMEAIDGSTNGNGNGKLLEIFKKVSAGEMDFDEFLTALK